MKKTIITVLVLVLGMSAFSYTKLKWEDRKTIMGYGDTFPYLSTAQVFNSGITSSTITPHPEIQIDQNNRSKTEVRELEKTIKEKIKTYTIISEGEIPLTELLDFDNRKNFGSWLIYFAVQAVVDTQYSGYSGDYIDVFFQIEEENYFMKILKSYKNGFIYVVVYQ